MTSDTHRRKLQPYDPARLVQLAREQLPDKPWLASALARCTRGVVESRGAYISFVSRESPNKPGSEWQFERNLLLDSRKEGRLCWTS